MKEVKAECEECSGTGLYQGMCEKKHEAVVCIRCDGTGCRRIRYRPFEGRKGRRGIERVYRSRGPFIATGVGPQGDGVTYADFAKGMMP